jgi:hypothetical protein
VVEVELVQHQQEEAIPEAQVVLVVVAVLMASRKVAWEYQDKGLLAAKVTTAAAAVVGVVQAQ